MGQSVLSPQNGSATWCRQETSNYIPPKKTPFETNTRTVTSVHLYIYALCNEYIYIEVQKQIHLSSSRGQKKY